MSRYIPRLFIFIALSFMFACSLFSVGEGGGSSGGGGDKQAMFEKMYSDAEAINKEVSSMGGQWSNVDELLEKAQAEAKVNKYDEAIALTKKASEFSMIAKQQFMEQANAKPALF